MIAADRGDVGVVARDLPSVGDAVAEPLTSLQMAGRMAIAAGEGVAQGEVDHGSQGDGGRQGMGLAQLVGGGLQKGVLVAIELWRRFSTSSDARARDEGQLIRKLRA